MIQILVVQVTTMSNLLTATIARVDVTRTFQKQVDYVQKSTASGYVQPDISVAFLLATFYLAIKVTEKPVP